MKGNGVGEGVEEGTIELVVTGGMGGSEEGGRWRGTVLPPDKFVAVAMFVQVGSPFSESQLLNTILH